jgi:hypothetical protein
MRRASSWRTETEGKAATAGPKTSPTTAIRLLATKTGQKLGEAKIFAAPRASAPSAIMITPRLARVSSIAAPIGVCAASPSRAADHGYKSGFGLAPMLLRNWKNIAIRPESAARTSAISTKLSSAPKRHAVAQECTLILEARAPLIVDRGAIAPSYSDAVSVARSKSPWFIECLDAATRLIASLASGLAVMKRSKSVFLSTSNRQ